jgi:hypothetical protein
MKETKCYVALHLAKGQEISEDFFSFVQFFQKPTIFPTISALAI